MITLKPSHFAFTPFNSILRNGEAEIVAGHIMRIRARLGDSWKLSWRDYKRERQKDYGFGISEKEYFNQVMPLISDVVGAISFSPDWAGAARGVRQTVRDVMPAKQRRCPGKCKTCKGAGTVRREGSPPDYVTCHTCGGRGTRRPKNGWPGSGNSADTRVKWKYTRYKDAGCSKWLHGDCWVVKFDDETFCNIGVNGKRNHAWMISSPAKARKTVESFLADTKHGVSTEIETPPAAETQTLPPAIMPLRSIVDQLKQANTNIEPGTKMLGVTDAGEIVFGIIMPSGKILCTGGVDKECTWSCEAASAVRAIGRLTEAAESVFHAMHNAQAALLHYSSAGCLTVGQQSHAKAALRGMGLTV